MRLKQLVPAGVAPADVRTLIRPGLDRVCQPHRFLHREFPGLAHRPGHHVHDGVRPHAAGAGDLVLVLGRLNDGEKPRRKPGSPGTASKKPRGAALSR